MEEIQAIQKLTNEIIELQDAIHNLYSLLVDLV